MQVIGVGGVSVATGACHRDARNREATFTTLLCFVTPHSGTTAHDPRSRHLPPLFYEGEVVVAHDRFLVPRNSCLRNLAGLQASLFAGKTERASDPILYQRYLDVASILQVASVILRLY